MSIKMFNIVALSDDAVVINGAGSSGGKTKGGSRKKKGRGGKTKKAKRGKVGGKKKAKKAKRRGR